MKLNSTFFITLLLSGACLHCSVPASSSSAASQQTPLQRTPSPDITDPANADIVDLILVLKSKNDSDLFCRNLAKLMKVHPDCLTTPAQAQAKIIELAQSAVDEDGRNSPTTHIIKFTGNCAEYWLSKYEEKEKQYQQVSQELQQLKSKKEESNKS